MDHHGDETTTGAAPGHDTAEQEHPGPRRARRWLRITIGGAAVIAAVAVGAAMVSAHAQRQEEIRAAAQEDARLIAASTTRMQSAHADYLQLHDEAESFLVDQLTPALEVARGNSAIEAELVEDFGAGTDEIASRLTSAPDLPAVSVQFEGGNLGAVLEERYLGTDDEGRAELRSAAAAESERHHAAREEFTRSGQELEAATAAAVSAFRQVLQSAADSAQETLTENDSASKDTRSALQALVDHFDAGGDLPVVFEAPAGDLSEPWLQVTDALSKHQEAAKKVTASHEAAIAPPPPPKKPVSTTPSGKKSTGGGASSGGGTSSGGGGGGGGSSGGGQCTWMKWGPVAPYWVWGPCSDMPKG